MASRLPVVESIDEEYRFIQFHPFECGCQQPPPRETRQREITSHGLHLRPMFLLTRLRLPLAIWVEDAVEVSCPRCRGRFTYQFDIRKLEHLRLFVRRWFGFYVVSQEAVMAHMEMVGRVSDRLGKLKFPGKAP